MTLAAITFPPRGIVPDPLALFSHRDGALRYVRAVFTGGWESARRKDQSEAIVVNEIERLIQEAGQIGAAAATARLAGEENTAEEYFRRAFTLTVDAVAKMNGDGLAEARQDIFHQSVRYALNCGEAKEARRLIALAGRHHGSAPAAEEWEQFHDAYAWLDSWLIAAVRRDPPDEKALDVLADRHWKPLFGRCLILTLNHHKASDLAQEAWCRVLRTRHALKPGGNFPAYLTTVATNLWRDWHRSARRAGLMAENQLASLDSVLDAGGGNPTSLADILPDLNGLEAEQKKLLMIDIDRALERLSPQLRDVLVSRFLADESCAEIGRRYGRTEQSASGWVRQAVQEMKILLAETGCSPSKNLP